MKNIQVQTSCSAFSTNLHPSIQIPATTIMSRQCTCRHRNTWTDTLMRWPGFGEPMTATACISGAMLGNSLSGSVCLLEYRSSTLINRLIWGDSCQRSGCLLDWLNHVGPHLSSSSSSHYNTLQSLPHAANLQREGPTDSFKMANNMWAFLRSTVLE